MKPNKRLGQHLLIDKKAMAKVVAAAQITKSDVILEIGPGTGLLTKELAQRAKKVIAIEKDLAMVDILGKTLKEYKNVEIISGDALSYKVPKVCKVYKVVANIPYYITSPLIRMFLEAENPPTEMILMIQKEVARRICAKPPNMSILAVSVQFYATPKIISYVPKGCFWPVPNVDSAIIKITPNKMDARRPSYNDDFFRVVKAGFLHPRKKLINNLAEGLTMNKEAVLCWLASSKIDPASRAETLTIKNWLDLTNDQKN